MKGSLDLLFFYFLLVLWLSELELIMALALSYSVISNQSFSIFLFGQIFFPLGLTTI